VELLTVSSSSDGGSSLYDDSASNQLNDGCQPAVDRTKQTNVGGVLIDAKTGCLQALWIQLLADYDPSGGNAIGGRRLAFAGLPVEFIRPTLDAFTINEPILFYLDVEFRSISLAKARKLGLPNKYSNQSHTVIQVHAVFPETPGPVALEEGDIVLSIGDSSLAINNQDDFLISRCLDIHRAVNANSRNANDDGCRLRVWRDGHELTVWQRPTPIPINVNINNNRIKFISGPSKHDDDDADDGDDDADDGDDAVELISWCGAVFQRPYRAVLEQFHGDRAELLTGSAKLEQVPYITCVMRGSPAEAVGLSSGYFALRLQDTSVSSLGQLIKQVKRVAFNNDNAVISDRYVRLELMHRSGSKRIVSLAPSEHYWTSWKFANGKMEFL
jgi:hypothetical protein